MHGICARCRAHTTLHALIFGGIDAPTSNASVRFLICGACCLEMSSELAEAGTPRFTEERKTTMTSIEEDILRAIKEKPRSQSELLLFFNPRYSVAEIRRACRRLAYRKKARCNVEKPYRNWHAEPEPTVGVRD